MLFVASPAFAANIKVKTRISDQIPTNVLGTSLTAPPNVQVIRSQRGVDHFLSKYRSFNNRPSYSKIKKLEKQLNAVNFEKYMIIAVLSQPMDNYKLSIKKIKLEDDVIIVDATYRHHLKNYRIPPKKSIYYAISVVEKMPQPVLLEAKMVKVRSRTKAGKKVTVTGRLMRYKQAAYQLVPVKIRRGKKNSYYITGEKKDELTPYLGKVITLAGTVSHEKNSPYEHDLHVDKLVKAYD